MDDMRNNAKELGLLKISIPFVFALFYASPSAAACFGEKCLITEADIAHCRNLYGAEQTRNACAPKCVPTTPAGSDARRACVDSCYLSFTDSFNACMDNRSFLPEQSNASVPPTNNRLSPTDVDPRGCVREGRRGATVGIKYIYIQNACERTIRVYYNNGSNEESTLLTHGATGEMQSGSYQNAPWPAITRVCIQGGECR